MDTEVVAHDVGGPSCMCGRPSFAEHLLDEVTLPQQLLAVSGGGFSDTRPRPSDSWGRKLDVSSRGANLNERPRAP